MDITITGAAASGSVVDYPASTTSGGVGAVTVVCNPLPGTTFPVGTTTVTCTATDAANNHAACTFKVTVVAAGPLTIACPANFSKGTDAGKCTAVVSYPAATTSGGIAPVTVVSNPPSGSTFPKGVTTVTCTATDGAGNHATCSFTVTVTDGEKPSITCPMDKTITDAPAGGVVVTYPLPTALDNCDTPTLTCIPASGTTFRLG